jgi:ABC-type multidrug transport system ATPase subunit
MACKGATLRGSVLVNGQPRNDGAFRRMSAYVQQDDVLYAHQTVRETLDMAAQLRLHDASSKSERDALVDNLVTQLGLVKAQVQPCHPYARHPSSLRWI